MNSEFWPLCRLWVRIRRGRVPPPQVPDPVWYFAYGSNMNERLFWKRRHMTPIETRIGRLADHRLCFSVAGGMRPGLSAHANTADDPGGTVHGVLYLLPLRKFIRLDASEGRQYAYLWTEAEDAAGNTVPMVTYKVRLAAPEGQPSLRYLKLIREAARQRELPEHYVAFLEHVKHAGR